MKLQNLAFDWTVEFPNPSKIYHDWPALCTQSGLAPSSDRAERRADGSHAPRIIIRHPSINMTEPGGDPAALEHHFAARTVLFFCPPDLCIRNKKPKHLTDFSELHGGPLFGTDNLRIGITPLLPSAPR